MNDRRAPLLEVRGVSKDFAAQRFFRRGEPLRAVDEVDLSVDADEVVGLVGESGSGKTTLARCILGLERPDAGTVVFDGIDVARAKGQDLRRVRRGMQPIFQDPYSSLDPRWTVARTVREALDAQRIGDRAHRDHVVRELLDRVGLPTRFAPKRPSELSSGQRQRVCIAAALASQPRLLVADEPVTQLDVSIQAQVLNLLHELQRDLGLAVLIVAHDLGVVAHVSDRVAVMFAGRVVEQGPTAGIFDDPRDPYTRSLLAARPRLHRA
jgi:peptide/nickel transport system ATP-binding protein/oligopeptide transport system ATP-binding protein